MADAESHLGDKGVVEGAADEEAFDADAVLAGGLAARRLVSRVEGAGERRTNKAARIQVA